MDYRLFDDLERDLEERKSLLLFDKALCDLSPERAAQLLLAQLISEEEESFAQLEQLYHSVMKQSYSCEDRPFPQIISFENGLQARLLREIRAEQDYGEQCSRQVDSTMHQAMFGQFCASLSRVQRLMYLLIITGKGNQRRAASV